MEAVSSRWHRYSGDFWGGLSAMLVALPASVAFGVTVYTAVGPQYGAFGALAGVLGAATLGLLASAFGGTERLISAPCAPAAAVLSAFAIDLVAQGVAPLLIILMMTVLGILTGLIQILIGFLGVGRLIRYIPYPVVSGYMSGVGLVILGSQLPKLLGAAQGSHWAQVILQPAHWDGRALTIGAVTMIVMVMAPKFTKKIPGTILGILSGLLAYALFALIDARLRGLEGNTLVIGAFGANAAGYAELIAHRWREIGEFKLVQIAELLGSALTLGILLSIDTLKTCVIIDQKTRSRHEPNRELVAQGLANMVSASIGGMCGAGTMGPTLINLSSGAKTRLSGVIAGGLSMLVALMLGAFVAWIPSATLSAILMVVGFRMIDTEPIRFLESRATMLDFLVVLAVVGVALSVGLIAASIVGVALSVILFLREQVGGRVVRRQSVVGQRSSTWYRPELEMRLLEERGHRSVIVELQGSLFFGTSYQLYTALEPELERAETLILDLKRVQSLDVTAAHTLCLIRDILAERGVPLLLSGLRERLPNGRNLREFLELTGLSPDDKTLIILPTLEAAIDWAEDRLLDDLERMPVDSPLLALEEVNVFKGSQDDTLKDLERYMRIERFAAGERIYVRNDPDTNLYLIRKGEVRIMAPVAGSEQPCHIASYRRGDFFGALAFLDRRPRGNDAVAAFDVELFVLSQEMFEEMTRAHKRVALLLLLDLGRTLAVRLRYADNELALLQES